MWIPGEKLTDLDSWEWSRPCQIVVTHALAYDGPCDEVRI